MSVYYEKAKELGELILESEEAKAVADSNYEYKKDEEAVKSMTEYQNFYAKLQNDMKSQSISQEEVSEATKKLSQMASDVKLIPSVAALVYAENEFNSLISNTIKVLQSTITGEDISAESGGCPSGGCSNCKGCN